MVARSAVKVKKEEPPKEWLLSELNEKNTEGKFFKLVPGQAASGVTAYGTYNRPPEMFQLFVPPRKIYDERIYRDVMCPAVVELNGVSLLGPMKQYTTVNFKVVELKEKSEELVRIVERAEIAALSAKLGERHWKHIGVDPEIFAIDKDGVLIPAFEFLNAKEKNPSFFWDGYQAEFTTSTCECLDSQVHHIFVNFRRLNQALKAKLKDARLTMQNTFEIPAERLTTDKPEYVKFGCKPSLNVYGETFPEVDATLMPIRSAGGHMHFSLTAGQDAATIVKALDRILGVISVATFQHYDDPRRRVMYGRAGEYRKTSYGIEYRVLSNAWLCHKVMFYFVFEVARVVIANAIRKGSILEGWDVTEEEARKCINDCDVDLAKALLARNTKLLQAILLALPGIKQNMSGQKEKHMSKVMNAWMSVIFDGVHTHLRNPDVPSSNWRLDGHDEYGSAGQMAHLTPALVSTGFFD